jgi:predicted Zn-dependent protease
MGTGLNGRELAPMAAPRSGSGDPHHDRPSPEISTRKLREQSQLDFEVEFLGRILDRDPYFVEALRAQAGNLALKGQYTRALQLDRRLVRLEPDCAVAWYNLACSYALLGMVDPALDSLEQALERGYGSFRWLRRDPDLRSIRRDERFAVLIRRYEQRL